MAIVFTRCLNLLNLKSRSGAGKVFDWWATMGAKMWPEEIDGLFFLPPHRLVKPKSVSLKSYTIYLFI